MSLMPFETSTAFAAEPIAFRPSVVCVADEDATQAKIRAQLGDDYDLLFVAREALVAALLSTRTVALLLASWDARTVEIAHATRPELWTIVLGDSAVPSDALIDTALQGTPLRYVPGAKMLPAVLAAIRPPRGAVARHRLDGIIVSWNGNDFGYAVDDISNGGISFRIPVGTLASPPCVGDILADISVGLPTKSHLNGVDAIVQRIRADETGYVVGCTLSRRTASARQLEQTIEDPALILGLLTRAAADGIDVKLGGRRVGGSGGEVLRERQTLRLPLDAPALTAFDLVECSFEARDSQFTFVTAVVDNAPLTLKLPRRIVRVQRRAVGRFRPLPERAVMVELALPFSRDRVFRRVEDISTAGLSVQTDPAFDLLPIGCEIAINIRIAGEELRCTGSVLGFDAETQRSRIAFTGMSEAAKLRLADLILRARFPEVQEASSTSFDELWRCFRESAFIPPAKQTDLEPQLPRIRVAFEALHARRHNLLKTVLVKDADRVVGHVSAIRAYRRTLMCQHLAAVVGYNVGPQLNLAVAEFFSQNPALDYFRIWYFSDASWSNRVFGDFARRVTDTRLSDLRAVAHFEMPTDLSFPIDPEIAVMEASASELALVEHHLVGREPAIILSSDDLHRGGLQLGELNAEFRALGLERRRRVLVATANSRLLGFALLEISSPGLNLYEALSSFQIVVTSAGMSRAQNVRASLLSAAMPIYRQSGRMTARGLLPLQEADAYRELGLTLDEKHSMRWTCHRSLWRQFSDHVEALGAKHQALLKLREERRSHRSLTNPA
jgi:hypothetical protein